MAGPVGVEELAARLVHALVGVRAEIIALGLEQIGRQPRAAVAVVKVQRGGEGRGRDALARGRGHDLAPGPLAFLDFAAEKLVQQQIRQLRDCGRRPP